MVKQTLRQRVGQLEAELEKEKRHNLSFQEWFYAESKGHATTELEVTVGGQSAMRVVVHGMSRASGGTCIVHCDGYRDFPRFLDDLCAEWSKDSAPEIREAAALLLKRREEYLSLDKAV